MVVGLGVFVVGLGDVVVVVEVVVVVLGVVVVVVVVVVVCLFVIGLRRVVVVEVEEVSLVEDLERKESSELKK